MFLQDVTLLNWSRTISFCFCFILVVLDSKMEYDSDIFVNIIINII